MIKVIALLDSRKLDKGKIYLAEIIQGYKEVKYRVQFLDGSYYMYTSMYVKPYDIQIPDIGI